MIELGPFGEDAIVVPTTVAKAASRAIKPNPRNQEKITPGRYGPILGCDVPMAWFEDAKATGHQDRKIAEHHPPQLTPLDDRYDDGSSGRKRLTNQRNGFDLGPDAYVRQETMGTMVFGEGPEALKERQRLG